jgi:hypothetical protein
MSTTADRLDIAAFPEDYAGILIETLTITAANFPGVKDALNHYRSLDDGEAAEVMRQIAEDTAADADPADDPSLARAAPYFRGASGTRHLYSDIAARIRREAPHTLGQHIFVQLEAIGLLEEMRRGVTPCGLPFTFAEEPRLIRKQLTSSGLFHTPGVFRALRNDYRIEGAPRRRAVKTLADGYGLPRAEAEGLLSGTIPIAIDEAAGTITYTVASGTLTTNP